MTRYLLIYILLFASYYSSKAQAFFTSNANGDWNSTTSWTLVSGTSSSNYPVAGDSVIIQSGHSIQVISNSQCQSLTIKGGGILNNALNTSILTITNDLLITETSAANIDAGILTVTGNLTINQKSVLTQDGGAVNVIGLIFLNSPTTSTGNTTLNINTGVFSCIGGITITATTVPSGRIAEVKIGNSAVNVVGALNTISSNAKITFTGIGALTLAGVINISNPLSFNAGNGRVVYIGIPGANQNVAALTYKRLVITGVGNGSKTIAGNAVVTDTLTLLTDTLLTTGTGTLTLNNNATIVKTAGKLFSAPVYLGQIDIIYNDVQKDTTGAEMPVSTTVLRNLYINNISGVKLAANTTVNNKLTLQNGELFTDNFILTINNLLGGSTTDPAVERVNGYVRGKINRAIGASTGVRIFPFGIATLQGYREFKIDYTTAPTSAGTLSMQHFNNAVSSQSGLPLADGSVIISTTQPYYWQADAINGLAGGNYNVTLTGEGSTGISDFNGARILRRPSSGGSWVLQGTAGSNSGTNAAPIVVRNGMSNFSQFAIGYNTGALPLTLLNFTASEVSGNVLLKWKTTAEINTAYFNIEKSNTGNTFIEIAKVYAVPFSSIENNYQYSDATPNPGKLYYRLKMADKNGMFTYSPIVSVSIKKSSPLIVYPTIISNTLNISTNEKTILLYNSVGQVVLKLNNGSNNMHNLPAGFYVLKTGLNTIQIIKK